MLTVQSPRSPPHPPFVPLVFLLLLTIAALNDQHNEESIYFGNHYCYIVKPRVFARCAILSFTSVAFGIVYYITLVEEKNCNNSCDSMYPNHGGIAMGQPQIPTQKRLFEAFLGSSSSWQPCKDHHTSMMPSSMMNNKKSTKLVSAMLGNNSLNVAAPPFYVSKSSLSFKEQPMPQPPIENPFSETLKRTRSENATGSMRVLNDVGELNNNKLHRD
ncbi:hypothetical protein AHAS_Ahas14G0183900 [Arachis hypogaea]